MASKSPPVVLLVISNVSAPSRVSTRHFCRKKTRRGARKKNRGRVISDELTDAIFRPLGKADVERQTHVERH